MPTRKYVPRAFFQNDIDFGDPTKKLLWRGRAEWPPNTNEDQAAAAWTQHLLAGAILSQVEARYASMLAFTKAAGINYDRFGRIVRGEYVMRLEDVALAGRLLGVQLRLIESPPRLTGWP
jgi:hypothetical protein